MFSIGKILAAPIRIANVPFRAMEKLVDYTLDQPSSKEDRIVSAPLECIAEAIEEAVDGEKP